MEPIRSFSRQRRPSSSDRFLSLFSHSPPSPAAPAFSTSSADEMSEDDVFWNAESSKSTNPLSTFSKSIPQAKSHRLASKFGILAAVPEIEHDRNQIRQNLSSARMIPLERTLSSSFRHHQYQSAPMNVPLRMRNDFEEAEMFKARDLRQEGRYLEDNDLEEVEMLPPHEIVAKKAVKAEILSCSVLEGAGRTLKGRDLRQVRNAVFRQTGFID